MAVGDGVTWNEAAPDNDTVANQIDDYNRDLRVGARSRLAREHVWPSSQTATNEGGHHNFITLQAQTAAPTMAGTTAGAIYVDSVASGYQFIFVNSAATGVTLVNSGGRVTSLGTQGSIAICHSAGGLTTLTGSTDGLVLVSHSNTAAPSWTTIAEGVLAAAAVDQASLKTSTGEVSVTGTTPTNLTLPGGEYGFYPQVKTSGTATGARFVNVGWGMNDANMPGFTTYATIAGVYTPVGGETVYVQQRYVTSSGKDHWLFLLLDKLTGEIIAAYSAPDHPAYGNGGDFNELPHPFIGYNEAIHDIVLVDIDTINDLKTKTTRKKSLLTLVNESYKVDTSKEEVYKPLHSGKFLDKDKQISEMVESIPAYIKVRKLIKNA